MGWGEGVEGHLGWSPRLTDEKPEDQRVHTTLTSKARPGHPQTVPDSEPVSSSQLSEPEDAKATRDTS